jgi:hypothetical protein
MKIRYLDCDGKDKLFSFHQHDYRSKVIDGNRYMVDGGCNLSDAYFRTSFCGTTKIDTVENLIKDIREQFTWTSQFDFEEKQLAKSITKKLKDLTLPHLYKLIDFCESSKLLVEIFNQEIKYRNNECKHN